MTDTGFKPQNYRIYRRVTLNRILTVEDALAFGKLKWTLVHYQKGDGKDTEVVHFMDHQTAALLAFDILRHDPARSPLVWWNGYHEYKGTRKDDDLQARTFLIEIVEAKNPVKITVTNGPGEPVGNNGAIKPANGAQQDVGRVLLPWTAARSMALAICTHLQAWHTMTYFQRLREGTWQPPDDPNGSHVDPDTGEILNGPRALNPRRVIPDHPNTRPVDPTTGEVLEDRPPRSVPFP